MNKPENRLADATSPYLRQHASNPVAWQPWGEAAFARAAAEGKPIFLSIGYATCYWCHVMAHDSFEHDEVAAVLNEHFVSIKVDREERPDLDQVYMDAVMGFSGHGGWPMSVFLTPDRKPFWAGTFYYRAQFLDLLQKLSVAWREDREKILTAANSVTEALGVERSGGEAAVVLAAGSSRLAVQQAQEVFDATNGGFGPAPKFPAASLLELLLKQARSGDRDAHLMAESTLDAMARGGIHDHVAGGFARYATDARWVVPHFEKMLYDNALLASLYLEAGVQLRNPAFLWVGERVLAFLERELQAPEGGFYSAIDAGEVDREGAFYVWRAAELRTQVAEPMFSEIERLFGVTEAGNFEGQSVLVVPRTTSWPAVMAADSLRDELMKLRTTRTRPSTDQKLLTSWNGLAVRAFARGYRLANNPHYLAVALRTAALIRSSMSGVRCLLHQASANSATEIRAFLDDYAYLIDGYLELATATMDSSWVHEAVALFREATNRLWSDDANCFAYSDYDDVLFEKREFVDNATPSPYAVMADCAIQLALWTGNQDYREVAGKILTAMAGQMSRYPFGSARALVALERYHHAPAAVVVAATTQAEALKYVRSANIDPAVITAWADPAVTSPYLLLRDKPCAPGGALRAYRCDGQGCQIV